MAGNWRCKPNGFSKNNEALHGMFSNCGRRGVYVATVLTLDDEVAMLGWFTMISSTVLATVLVVDDLGWW